ncbi:MAG: right-handed parallel beta-helix repeat-containing protein [Candidatus Marithrix sp.]
MNFVIFILLISLSFITNAASFDCLKANLSLEKSICNNLQLDELDEQMGKVYLSLRKMLGKDETTKLTQKQRNWLKQRLQICSSQDVNCLMQVYQNHIGYLKTQQCANLQSAINLATKDKVIELEEITCHYKDSLQIQNKTNLTITGQGDVWIIVDNIYTDVITIQDSQRIFLKNIKARHKKPLPTFNCEGAVINIINSNYIWLNHCELNGSGAVGVQVEKSTNIIVNQCYIHHNTLAAFWLDNSDSIAIHDNTITENGSTIYGLTAGDIRMNSNIISNNQGSFTWSSPFTKEIMGE